MKRIFYTVKGEIIADYNVLLEAARDIGMDQLTIEEVIIPHVDTQAEEDWI